MLTYREAKNIGIIAFDRPDSPVNLLDGECLTKLGIMLDEIKGKTTIKALVILSMKPNIFIAGADISEIENITDPDDGQKKAEFGQKILNKIEDLDIPTIAVIDGVALGGGCELALACDYRVSTFNPKVRIGLPEVNLGFVPGFGGTYRLPRIVGLSEGMKMILSGKPVDADKALRSGLVDQLFPQKGLEHQMLAFVEDIVEGKFKKDKYSPKKKKGVPGFLEGNRIGHGIIFKESRKSVMKLTKGFYPAPLQAIDVVSQNLYCGRDKGLLIESKAFGKLSVTDVSKNCIKVFYLSEKYRKLKAPDSDGVSAKNIQRCGVLGAGIMGGGIAQLMSYKDIFTRMKDINHEAVAKGYQAAAKVYQGLIKKRRLSKSEAAAKMAQITGTVDYSGFNRADIVIEAVVEKMEIKQKVFK